MHDDMVWCHPLRKQVWINVYILLEMSLQLSSHIAYLHKLISDKQLFCFKPGVFAEIYVSQFGLSQHYKLARVG